MSTATEPRKSTAKGKAPAGEKVADWADGRLGIYGLAKANMRKIFPDHWSFLLGEICLFSFIIVILTGVYLTLFFVPSMGEVEYTGSFGPMQGVMMSEAYASTLDISFDVRGGLLVRQIHHWAALLFVVGIFMHMMRVFFTGAFRKPREVNWIFGFLLLVLALFTGLTGYSLPDDLLSGTGIRFMEGAILAVPVLGTYLQMSIFGGEFPGHDIIPRFFVVHVLLLPGIMVGLVVAHLILIVYHKHTHYAGPGRTNNNVVGMPFMPVYMAKAGGFFFLIFGVITLIAATVTINPVWVLGPYRPDQISTNAQPDWYLGFSEGLVRMMPGFEWVIPGGYTLNFGLLVPLAIFPTLLVAIAVYPFFEAWVTKDPREHHIAERPRNNPTRTAFGMAWLTAFAVAMLAGGNDVWAVNFHLSINAITWFCRIAFFVLPVLVFFATRRVCLGLQRRDADKVLHGRESGIIKRLPHGEFIEVHEPLPQDRLYTLTAHEQRQPLELGPATDENGVRRPVSPVERVRARMSKAYFGEQAQIPKPTREEYRAIAESHDEHH
ncbi:ubiquinol-cytochrome c reductase cytochrome b subunit [Streptomyces sp. 3MP-14]|uniref:Cytochrome bc1 complex cytochrome b subunit n=1 Tax=Streptomyces mimosae TaxID=2586635 RepID=A0A5N6AKP9_9ACTN|nr:MULTISPECIES: ubiquinol-cytochrome c reductase cytochrome b subunit [Streptomyces]KAB8168623.1 ubiquinol-cytochrome c reductase cytochrome b subunit [Streptomyces mimosae]KAB8178097.1 ubiquinol-cytochrome c reductase cytochrome b subunit [Streptomyces sp. 3MP-14]